MMGRRISRSRTGRARKQRATARQGTRSAPACERAIHEQSEWFARALPAWTHRPLLAVAAVGVFLGALSAGFTFDDHSIVLKNEAIRYWHFWDLFTSWGRHVRTLSLMVDWALFEREPLGYHVHSLLWHVANVLLLYALVRRISEQPLLAFGAALLFAVHPIHVEAVANVANRKEPLALAFSLVTALAYLRAVAASGGARVGWLAACASSWLVALFAKQIAIALPLSLVVYEALFVPAERRMMLRYPRLLLAAASVGAVVAVALVFHFYDLEDPRNVNTVSGYAGEADVAALVLTAGRAYWTYLGLMIWPAGLCPDHEVVLSRSLWEPLTLLAWLGLAGWVAACVWIARHDRLLAFALSWILIHWLPISNLVPAAYVLADRYMYVPSVGFCLAAVCALAWLRGWLAPRLPLVATCAVALALAAGLGYAWRTISYVQHWQTETAVWEYALTCNPNSHRAHFGIGQELARRGRNAEALPHFAEAVRLEPAWEAAHYAWANMLHATGRLREALRIYDLAIGRWPEHAGAYYNRGVTHAGLGAWDRAIADYDRAIELQPELSEAYANRGIARTRIGRQEAALADYQRAIALKPENAAAHFNLALLHERTGNLPEAFRSYASAANLGVAQARLALEKLAADEAEK